MISKWNYMYFDSEFLDLSFYSLAQLFFIFFFVKIYCKLLTFTFLIDVNFEIQNFYWGYEKHVGGVDGMDVKLQNHNIDIVNNYLGFWSLIWGDLVNFFHKTEQLVFRALQKCLHWWRPWQVHIISVQIDTKWQRTFSTSDASSKLLKNFCQDEEVKPGGSERRRRCRLRDEKRQCDQTWVWYPFSF